MEQIRLKYTGGKSVAKLYFNRIRFVFNKENNFTENVPLGVWIFVKETNEFIPAPIESKETTQKETTPEKPKKKSGWICDVCGFKAKSKTGLIAHKRIKHKGGK